MLIWETVIWDMLTRAFTPTSRGNRRHGHGGLEVPGGHGHAEVDPPTAADDPIDVSRFEKVSDQHLGASNPQRRRPVVLAADHRANPKPALKEQAGDGSPDRPELTGCPGYEDGSVIGHATSHPSPNVGDQRWVGPARALRRSRPRFVRAAPVRAGWESRWSRCTGILAQLRGRPGWIHRVHDLVRAQHRVREKSEV